MWDQFVAYGQIILADLVLSGDNALVIGMAAAGLSPELRKKAIFYGLVIAAVLRIVFAVIATTLLGIPGLLFAGGLLLLWVCWSLYQDIRAHTGEKAEEAMGEADHGGYEGQPKKTLKQALIAIMIADVSMSIDNVLAVAAIAQGDTTQLVIGLGLAILLMAFAATAIMHLLARYPVISWLGLAVLVYVSYKMLSHGIYDCDTGVGQMLGFISDTQCNVTDGGVSH